MARNKTAQQLVSVGIWLVVAVAFYKYAWPTLRRALPASIGGGSGSGAGGGSSTGLPLKPSATATPSASGQRSAVPNGGAGAGTGSGALRAAQSLFAAITAPFIPDSFGQHVDPSTGLLQDGNGNFIGLAPGTVIDPGPTVFAPDLGGSSAIDSAFQSLFGDPTTPDFTTAAPDPTLVEFGYEPIDTAPVTDVSFDDNFIPQVNSNSNSSSAYDPNAEYGYDPSYDFVDAYDYGAGYGFAY